MKKVSVITSLSILTTLALFLSTSCKKYLDAKPNAILTTATSVDVLQALLDNNRFLNWLGTEAGEASADNIYITDAVYNALNLDCKRNEYLWKPEIFAGITSNGTDWAREYNVVYQANVVLDNIDKINRAAVNAAAWDNCKGSAYVFRAKAFYEIAQVWAKGYDSSSAGQSLGIVLRLTSDFNVQSTRATIRLTYDQIIKDLQASVSLLPNTPSHPFRPSKAAAYGLLSRVFLTVGDYQRAKLFADSCLNLSNTLLDYNSLSAAAPYPFPQFSNAEDIMHSFCAGSTYLGVSQASIDSNLFKAYDVNDLRKTLYFKIRPDKTVSYRGSYDGRDTRYNGVATDEMYLTRAECYARAGNTAAALNDLNYLLSFRWKKGTFIPFTAPDATAALQLILAERRKELLMRGLRFTDIKRLNLKGANIVQMRVIAGQTYTLQPNDPRYALPIPDDVIKSAGIQQN